MEIIKFKARFSDALGKLSSHLQITESTLATLRRKIAGGLQDLQVESKKGREKLRAASQAVIVFSKGKIARLGSQLSIVRKELPVYRDRAQMAVLATRRIVADRLEKLHAASQKAFQNLRTASRDAIAFSYERIAPLAFWVSTARRQFTAKAQVAVSHAGISALEKLHTLQRESKEELQKLRTSSHDALVHEISHFGSQISTAARQLAVPFQKANHSLVTAGKNVINKPRTIREARRARQTELILLLAHSPDAIVVTDRDGRLVAANSIALDLLGISEHNLRNFTMDAFLVEDPFPDVEANPPAFPHREDRHCKCKIRRLDGSLRVAECVLVGHGLPGQHLYKFINAAPYRITPQVASRKLLRAAR